MPRTSRQSQRLKLSTLHQEEQSPFVFKVDPQCVITFPADCSLFVCDICNAVLESRDLFKHHYLKLHINHALASISDLKICEGLPINYSIYSEDAGCFRCHLCVGLFFNKKLDLKSHLSSHSPLENIPSSISTMKPEFPSNESSLSTITKLMTSNELPNDSKSLSFQSDVLFSSNELQPLPISNLTMMCDESTPLPDTHDHNHEKEVEGEPLSGLVGSSLRAVFNDGSNPTSTPQNSTMTLMAEQIVALNSHESISICSDRDSIGSEDFDSNFESGKFGSENHYDLGKLSFNAVSNTLPKFTPPTDTPAWNSIYYHSYINNLIKSECDMSRLLLYSALKSFRNVIPLRSSPCESSSSGFSSWSTDDQVQSDGGYTISPGEVSLSSPPSPKRNSLEKDEVYLENDSNSNIEIMVENIQSRVFDKLCRPNNLQNLSTQISLNELSCKKSSKAIIRHTKSKLLKRKSTEECLFSSNLQNKVPKVNNNVDTPDRLQTETKASAENYDLSKNTVISKEMKKSTCSRISNDYSNLQLSESSSNALHDSDQEFHEDVSTKDSNIEKQDIKEESIEKEEILCLLCDRVCFNNKSVSTHLYQWHKKRRGGKVCCHCRSNFKTTEQLFTHLCSNHKDIYFACADCKLRFDSKNSLSVHFKFTHNVSNSNDFIEIENNANVDLNSNVVTETKQSFMSIIDCVPKVSSRNVDAEKSNIIESPVKLELEFTNNELNQIEYEDEENGVQYDCLNKCGITADGLLDECIDSYCLFCNLPFDNSKTIEHQNHVTSFHEGENNRDCMYCSEKFENCDVLLNHLRCDHFGVFIDCCHCKIRFESQASLKNHQKENCQNVRTLNQNNKLNCHTEKLIKYIQPNYENIKKNYCSDLEITIRTQLKNHKKNLSIVKPDIRAFSPQTNLSKLPKFKGFYTRGFSGEWARQKNYFCANCGAHFIDFWEFDNHRWSEHSLTECSVYDFYVEQTPPCYFDNTSWPYNRVPPLTTKDKIEIKKIAQIEQPNACTKCQKPFPKSQALRHKHIVTCAEGVSQIQSSKQVRINLPNKQRKRRSCRGFKAVLDTPPKKLTPLKSPRRTLNSPIRNTRTRLHTPVNGLKLANTCLSSLKRVTRTNSVKKAIRDLSFKNPQQQIKKTTPNRLRKRTCSVGTNTVESIDDITNNVNSNELTENNNTPNANVSNPIICSPRKTRRQSVFSDIDDEKTKELIEKFQRGKYNNSKNPILED